MKKSLEAPCYTPFTHVQRGKLKNWAEATRSTRSIHVQRDQMKQNHREPMLYVSSPTYNVGNSKQYMGILVEAPSYTWELHGNCRDKPIIEFDPEIEKTLKKNRNRVKAQRALQFDQEKANSEEGAYEKSFEEEIVEENTKEVIQDNMANNANNQQRTLAD
ncbi:hypothetical protein PIB30_077103 [Stylosanthes scabra]|uniref:Uncharacterized protein n=1 Tax=Stylosanthes scabra TaxID=79078 RepID=A0ABU6ZPB4_9FABA|nr:hypothetical protein [Stylosanthes scabra]